jgi:hypothetical protein
VFTWDVGSVADVSELHTESIFRFEGITMRGFVSFCVVVPFETPVYIQKLAHPTHFDPEKGGMYLRNACNIVHIRTA